MTKEFQILSSNLMIEFQRDGQHALWKGEG